MTNKRDIKLARYQQELKFMDGLIDKFRANVHDAIREGLTEDSDNHLEFLEILFDQFITGLEEDNND